MAYINNMDVYERAIRLLAIREHSRFELEKKLKDKGYERLEIDEALDRLSKEGYLSDIRFSSSYIRSRLRKNPEGRSVLILRLKEKGVSSEIANEALDEVWNEGLYWEPLKKAYSRLESKKGKDYAIISLRRKGFSLSEIRSACGEFESE